MNTKERIIKELENKRNIRFDVTEIGVTIWVNEKWVLDASLFKEDDKIRIDTKKFKQFKKSGTTIFELKYTEDEKCPKE